MKRLRHPVRAIREPFGTAGLIVACIALILALTGAAFAAGALTGKQKKEVEKIAKKFAGKPGTPGAQGATGPQGPAGANGKDGTNGKDGANGKDGTNGTNGTPGANGETPEAHPFTVAEEEAGTPPGEPCHKAGGVLYETESEENIVCNGTEGSPWTVGGTLPPGQQEKGTWAFSVSGGDDLGHALAPISFPIPLSEVVEGPFVFFKLEGVFETPGYAEHCGIGNPASPKVVSIEYEGGAKHATLCVTTGTLEHATFEKAHQSGWNTEGMSKVGGALAFEVTGAAHGVGAWAVETP
jgi:hypothetical protein